MQAALPSESTAVNVSSSRCYHAVHVTPRSAWLARGMFVMSAPAGAACGHDVALGAVIHVPGRQRAQTKALITLLSGTPA